MTPHERLVLQEALQAEEDAPSYSHSLLLKMAHDRLEAACRREESEVANG